MRCSGAAPPLRGRPTLSPRKLVRSASGSATLNRLVDRASGFEADLDYLRYLRTQDRSRSRWDRHDPSFLRFWYRESPQPLESWRYVFRYGNLSRVDPVDPPLDLAGMTLIRLDPSGRLVQLVVVPTSTGEAASSRES